MDNGGYCTYCTVNCTVSLTCPSSNMALRKSNTWDIHDPIYNLNTWHIFRIRYPLFNIIIILAMCR